MFEAARPRTCPGDSEAPAPSGPTNASPRDRDLERASGVGRITLQESGRGTEVVDIYQKFPTRIMLPLTGDDAVREAVFINAAGGIAGGDRLEFDVTALGNALVTVTSQAAEKIYRALDQRARVVTRLKACDAAKLAWLPQETIIFNSARIDRQTEIDLGAGVELMALEWLVLGRAAHGEEVAHGEIRDRWLVRRDGRPVWADSFLLTEETFAHLRRRALLSDCKAIGTLLYFGPDLDRRLELLRDVAQSLACHCAATMVNGLIIVRLAAVTSSDLRSALTCLLQHFREGDASPFRMPKMWSC